MVCPLSMRMCFTRGGVHLSENHAAVVRPRIECLSADVGIYRVGGVVSDIELIDSGR